MRYSVTVLAYFDSSHRLPDPPCNRLHGHRWLVEVEVGGDMGPRKIPNVERQALLAELHKLVSELDGRDLNEMLPVVPPTPENLAIQFMERLRLNWPRIARVTVAQDESTRTTITNEDSP